MNYILTYLQYHFNITYVSQNIFFTDVEIMLVFTVEPRQNIKCKTNVKVY